jgi:uncharacterized membrane protein
MNAAERAGGQSDSAPRGSIALGFGLAWLAMIAGYVVLFVLSAALPRGGSVFSIFLMPWVAAILLIIWLVATRRTRTALGVAVGLGTVLVVCVGLFMLLVSELSDNFH